MIFFMIIVFTFIFFCSIIIVTIIALYAIIINIDFIIVNASTAPYSTDILTYIPSQFSLQNWCIIHIVM